MDAASKKVSENIVGTRDADLRLAKLASEGDSSAQRRLVIRLMPLVRRTMSYMTNDQALAQDLAQIALIRILGNAGGYRGQSSLEFWAGKVSYRVALSEIKKTSKRKILAPMIPQPSSPFPIVDDAVASLHAKQKLSDMLSKMSKKHRIVLILRHIEGYSVSEIANLTGVPLNTIRERLRIARIKLRRALTREPELMSWVLGREK